ncbi:MAG: hypothetical protein PCALPYG88_2052 [uncultured Paraburkholderia sp.]|nr:MAG: hypothetical protein PCALPYG08_3043 [uncultured Paraburkholderia sp.]CAH2918619.1 MAG: hypothetical protein PCALPYG88_2052 [uncultured Paraburkholderia sp.]
MLSPKSIGRSACFVVDSAGNASSDAVSVCERPETEKSGRMRLLPARRGTGQRTSATACASPRLCGPGATKPDEEGSRPPSFSLAVSEMGKRGDVVFLDGADSSARTVALYALVAASSTRREYSTQCIGKRLTVRRQRDVALAEQVRNMFRSRRYQRTLNNLNKPVMGIDGADQYLTPCFPIAVEICCWAKCGWSVICAVDGRYNDARILKKALQTLGVRVSYAAPESGTRTRTQHHVATETQTGSSSRATGLYEFPNHHASGRRALAASASFDESKLVATTAFAESADVGSETDPTGNEDEEAEVPTIVNHSGGRTSWTEWVREEWEFGDDGSYASAYRSPFAISRLMQEGLRDR